MATPQLYQFWDIFRGELHEDNPYIISIGVIQLRLLELQDHITKTRDLQSKDLLEDQKDKEDILYYQDILYILKIIQSKFISRHHNDLLAGYFGIEKSRDLVTRKYF